MTTKLNDLLIIYYISLFTSSLSYMWCSWISRYIINHQTLGVQYLYLFFIASFFLLYFSKIWRSILVNLFFNKLITKLLTILNKFIPSENFLLLGILSIFYLLIEKDPHILEIVEWSAYSKYSLYFLSLYRCLAWTQFFYVKFLFNKNITDFFLQKKNESLFFYSSHLQTSSIETIGGKVLGWSKALLVKAGPNLTGAIESVHNQLPNAPKLLKFIVPSVSVVGVGTWVHNNGINTKQEMFKELRGNTKLIQESLNSWKVRYKQLQDYYNLHGDKLNQHQKAYILSEMEKISKDEEFAQQLLKECFQAKNQLAEVYNISVGKDNIKHEAVILKEKVKSFVSSTYQEKSVDHPCLELRQVRALIKITTDYQFDSNQITSVKPQISTVLEKIFF